MAADKNWPRWIFASVSNHFKQVAVDNDIPILIEGLEDRLSYKVRDRDHAELRIDGPILNEISRNCFRLNVDVNILLQSYMSEANRYILIENCGVFLEGVTNIPVFRYGTGPDDDSSYLGCLEIKDENKGGFGVHHFGQLKPDVRVRESIVTVSYSMLLTT
jgi:hypothetical protein